MSSGISFSTAASIAGIPCPTCMEKERMDDSAGYGENIVCVCGGGGWGRDECNKKVSTEQYIWGRGSGGGNGKGLSETS